MYTCIWGMLDPLDLTNHIWCLDIDIDHVPEGNAFLEAPIANKCKWGLVNLKEESKVRVPVLGTRVITYFGI